MWTTNDDDDGRTTEPVYTISEPMSEPKGSAELKTKCFLTLVMFLRRSKIEVDVSHRFEHRSFLGIT